MLRKLVVDRRDFAPFGDRFSGEGTTAVPLAMVAPMAFGRLRAIDFRGKLRVSRVA